MAELTDYPIQKNRQMLNLQFRLGLQQMYGPAADKVRDAFREFLRSCPLALRLPCGAFVTHTLPENVDTKGFDKSIFQRKLDVHGVRRANPVLRTRLGSRLPRGQRGGVCRVGRGKRADQRPRAVSRGLPDAQLEADHPRLLRREGVLCDRAHGVRG